MLSKENRIKKTKDFDLILKTGRTFRNNFFILKVLENKSSISRFAIITSLKVSKKATERNKIRRQILTFLEKNFNNIKSGTDVVFIVLSALKNKKFSEIEEILDDIFKKAKLNV